MPGVISQTRLLLKLLAFAVIPAVSLAQSKRALVVAIGRYEDTRNWKPISSVQDLPYIRAGLHRFGFTDDRIDTLKNEDATKAGILAALDRLADKTGRGDVVVFYFCGHGQQIMDDNGEPDEQDGYDESIVPYDAKGVYNPTGYGGENHLRDDELGMKLAAVSSKAGHEGNLLVMIDACHSGSATRADAFRVARGSDKPFASPDYVPANIIKFDGPSKGFSEKPDAMGNMVFISASGPDQLNYQTRDEKGAPVGSLSYAFAKACMELSPGDDYGLLFEKVKARIQADIPTQVPILEGDGRRQVFSGRFTQVAERVVVNNASWSSDSAFWFDRGFLHDLTEGSTLHLEELGGGITAGKGRVVSVTATRSMAVVEKPMDRRKGYSVVIDERVPPGMSLVLSVQSYRQSGRPGALERDLDALPRKFPWISISAPADMMVSVTRGAFDTLRLTSKTGHVIHTENVATGQSLQPTQWDLLTRAMHKEMRVSYIRNLPDGGSLANGVTAKVMAEEGYRDTARGEYVFSEGDRFSLAVENRSGRTVYYNLVNITPDNDIRVLIPYGQKPPADCQLRDKGVYTTPKLTIGKGTPPGKEVFKVVLSDQPFDLRPIIGKLAKRQERAGMSPMERLLEELYAEEEALGGKKRDPGRLAVDKTGMVTIGYLVN